MTQDGRLLSFVRHPYVIRSPVISSLYINISIKRLTTSLVNCVFQMDDSGIDSDTTKRHITAMEENDRVIIYINYGFVYIYLMN